MKKITITILLIGILICALALFRQNRQLAVPDYSAESFIGDWVATAFVISPEITAVDFYPEKYIDYKIHIGEKSYYMDIWDGIIEEDEEVSRYTIETERQEEYERMNKVYFSQKFDPFLCLSYIDKRGIKNFIGIIIDENTLICTTGAGYYKYERILH